MSDAQTSSGDSGFISISFPNVPVPVILNEYERWTGKRVIRDANVLGATLNIETTHPLTREEAAQFVEKSLLLNGIALIPSGEKEVKVVTFGGGKQPSSEGLPIIVLEEDLPDSDEVVTYLLSFKHLAPEEAARAITSIIQPHAYGNVTPLPQGGAVVITENVAVIRSIIELSKHIDVPPSETAREAIQLHRADASEVAETLVRILELDSNAPQGAATGVLPGAEVATSGNGGTSVIRIAAGGTAAPVTQAFRPKIEPISRQNRILVIARPIDLAYIKELISFFDEPPELTQVYERQLVYLPVGNFLPIVSDALLRGLVEEEQQSQVSGGATTQSGGLGGATTGAAVGGSGGQSPGGFGTTTTGSGFGSESLSGNTGGAGGSSLPQGGAFTGPQSIVVDKTLLIADTVRNTLLATGPPEHLEMIDLLLDSMDLRPRQIRISAVIAQLTLGDDFEFGGDFFRTLDVPGAGSRRAAGSLLTRTGQSQAIPDLETLTDFSNLANAAGSGLTLYGRVDPLLNVFLSALQSSNRFEVLSRPTVLTFNNEPAVIFTGQRIPFPRNTSSVLDPDGGTVNQVVNSSIDFEDVLLRIEVLPLINANDEITLRISQLNDSVIGTTQIGGDLIPNIATQSLETTVMVPNSSTVLLGGLISQDDNDNSSGIPVIVNLPWIGKALGSRTSNENRQELLIFIQPEIVDTDTDLKETEEDLRNSGELYDIAQEFGHPKPKVEVEPIDPKKQPIKALLRKLYRNQPGPMPNQ